MQGMVRAVLGLRDLSLDVPAASASLLTLLNFMLQVRLSLSFFLSPPPPPSLSLARTLSTFLERFAGLQDDCKETCVYANMC